MSKKQLIQQYVCKKISTILGQKETGMGKAALANLRRGVGKKPGELPELWGMFLKDAPDELCGSGIGAEEPSREEWAIYIALTLFAVHQQGSEKSVNCEKVSLGEAAAALMDDGTDEARERILRRFAPVVTAESTEELAHYLRSLVQLFKSKGITLDYPQLAGDLYSFQFEDTKKAVQLKWGRGFYQYNKEEKNNEREGE